ncbi:MAG: hypothetical protein QOG63_981 [Thermoleophilaceae bacterium]|nr:hypothetical protein [Thermoleophilaceae bacterium]
MSDQQQIRRASVHGVANHFRNDCRDLRDSLQLEMVVAQYLLRMRDVVTPEGVPVGDAITGGVIAELERHGDPLSHAILRGLAHLGTGAGAQRSAEAVARLAERGVGLTAKFADVATARAVGAWRETGSESSGEYVLFVEFEHPIGPRHSLALFVEPRHGGVAKHIALMHSMEEFDPDEPFHPSTMESLEIAAAGDLLREVLERSFGRSLDDIDDYRVVIASARAGAMDQEGAAARP